jgi:putative flippase GtrA
MDKKDLRNAFIIGAMVGLLTQPIISNLLPEIDAALSTFGIVLPSMTLRILFFLGFLVLAPAALFVLFLLGKVKPVFYQFGKFAAVGTSNSAVDIGILNLAIFITGQSAGVAYTVFAGMSAFCGTINSFFWNKFWTFGARDKAKEQLLAEAIRFYIVTFIAWLVNTAASSFVVNAIPHQGIVGPAWANIGKVIGILAGMMFNFLGYKFFVFKKASGEVQNIGEKVVEAKEKTEEWLKE